MSLSEEILARQHWRFSEEALDFENYLNSSLFAFFGLLTPPTVGTWYKLEIRKMTYEEVYCKYISKLIATKMFMQNYHNKQQGVKSKFF